MSWWKCSVDETKHLIQRRSLIEIDACLKCSNGMGRLESALQSLCLDGDVSEFVSALTVCIRRVLQGKLSTFPVGALNLAFNTIVSTSYKSTESNHQILVDFLCSTLQIYHRIDLSIKKLCVRAIIKLRLHVTFRFLENCQKPGLILQDLLAASDENVLDRDECEIRLVYTLILDALQPESVNMKGLQLLVESCTLSKSPAMLTMWTELWRRLNTFKFGNHAAKKLVKLSVSNLFHAQP